ncbi:hypothetical protein [Burkholderia cepacia]|uniref:hypothetical protein n=1 Tax=Burkholderia cepacia TaxID=292 RepID=UPI000666F3B3|nr:hypothetical protein [Burkholderia cepacia]
MQRECDAQVRFGLRETPLRRVLLVDDNGKRFLASLELECGTRSRKRSGLGERNSGGTGVPVPTSLCAVWKRSSVDMVGFIGG